MNFLASLTSAVRFRLAIGGALLLMGASFGAGWTVRGWLDDSHTLVAERKVQADKDARQAAAGVAVAKADTQGRAADAKFSGQAQTINVASDRVKKEISDAKSRADSAGSSRVLSADWVRLHTEAVRPGGDPAAPAGEPAGSPAAPGNAAGPTEWDALWVDAENGRRFAICRSQLNALIDFEIGADSSAQKTASPPSKAADSTGVVTAISGQ